MSTKRQNLSQEEIWDDSSLIDSWNEALNEYKKYHSIHAKGGSLRDLESQPETAVKADTGSEQLPAVETEETALESKTTEGNKEISSSHSESKGSAVPQGLPSFPIQTVLGSVQDESLKKLLMSWYYAGYYTGLYEGQQQTQQNHGS
ncbi:hypothetical protein ACHAPU_001823 [Fusarium lateritium]